MSVWHPLIACKIWKNVWWIKSDLIYFYNKKDSTSDFNPKIVYAIRFNFRRSFHLNLLINLHLCHYWSCIHSMEKHMNYGSMTSSNYRQNMKKKAYDKHKLLTGIFVTINHSMECIENLGIMMNWIILKFFKESNRRRTIFCSITLLEEF